jgi:hypothetical protein
MHINDYLKYFDLASNYFYYIGNDKGQYIINEYAQVRNMVKDSFLFVRALSFYHQE